MTCRDERRSELLAFILMGSAGRHTEARVMPAVLFSDG
jgi:hypothetical protein